MGVPFSLAFLITACAKGCSEPVSAIAASLNNSCSPISSVKDTKSVTDGFPTVNVPVLSKTIVLTLFAISICSPPLYNIPFSAPLPVPIIRAAGVAMPNAQGQAIIITETNARMEYVKPASPIKYHPKNTPIAITTIAGTKYFATWSTIFSNFALPVFASSTNVIILDNTVSWPTFVALTLRRPFLFMVATIATSPFALSTSMLSQVMTDSSIEEVQSMTMTSVGTFSPG